ncbi:LacI family DNA-binding transcriptional regulator [Massilia sp. IC2-476]|uniref:LacI family DNA-binding transcriptional regulator n=1 Tax=Massilia sp. IC2-476 TaxID=2887199 RepID=UPI001D129B35|nr:LacI family DNA-binding transcriptional regulator [Massilia sp. IC2-476]MCC2973917.1 LacI family transcriptional regulator [Massilia sp. IC2-476]
MNKASVRPVATVHEVARAAGVSAATVSRVLNGTARVAEDKRLAIEQAIAQLNYKPNVLARNLKSGSSRTVGILTQSLASGYFADAMAGVDEALQGTGYAPLIVSGHWKPEEEAERIALLIARRVDGLVILSGKLEDERILALSEQVPIVAFGRELQGENARGFCLDNYRGACDAVEHLVQHGHRDIAFIAGPPDHRDAQARLAGYRDTLAQHGIPHRPALEAAGDFSESGGLQALERLLGSGERFTAVFAANDLTAYGARLALYRRGIAVPDQVSVVGFDDLHSSMYTTPPLTTVRQPLFDVGQRLGRAILQMIRREPLALEAPQPTLVIRESVRAV